MTVQQFPTNPKKIHNPPRGNFHHPKLGGGGDHIKNVLISTRCAERRVLLISPMGNGPFLEQPIGEMLYFKQKLLQSGLYARVHCKHMMKIWAKRGCNTGYTVASKKLFFILCHICTQFIIVSVWINLS